jgi:hypothetical protein
VTFSLIDEVKGEDHVLPFVYLDVALRCALWLCVIKLQWGKRLPPFVKLS